MEKNVKGVLSWVDTEEGRYETHPFGYIQLIESDGTTAGPVKLETPVELKLVRGLETSEGHEVLRFVRGRNQRSVGEQNRSLSLLSAMLAVAVGAAIVRVFEVAWA